MNNLDNNASHNCLLSAMQFQQEQHDKLYHDDIRFLPILDRTKHMVFHLNKYIGKIFKALKTNHTQFIEEIIIDLYIINFSYANIFKVSLANNYSDTLNFDHPLSFDNLLLCKTKEDNVLKVVIDLSILVSKMSESIISFDKMGSGSHRKDMSDYTIILFENILKLSLSIGLSDIQEKISSRLFQVEKSHIHFNMLGNCRNNYKV